MEIFNTTKDSEVSDRISNSEIVLTNKVKITRKHIESAKSLRLIAIAATGSDNVDLQACKERGITVCNIRNYAINTVPEHSFALIFALRRSITAYFDSVRNGRWQEANQFCFFDHPIRDLAGSTLGIIGDGVLGQSVAKLGRALGMKVIFAGFKGVSGQGSLYTSFETALAESDIITLHCPLNEHTKNMIGLKEFELMSKKPLLINTARGGLVDENALGIALDKGLISGAGFDVVTEEPPSSNHPLMKLCNRPNFILTPHVAWASDEAIQGLTDQLMDNIEAFVSGHPRNVVSA
jgi:glycerate dehydrogenase